MRTVTIKTSAEIIDLAEDLSLALKETKEVSDLSLALKETKEVSDLSLALKETKEVSTEVVQFGMPGRGVPAGGVHGQFLMKSGTKDFAGAWADPSASDGLFSRIAGETVSALHIVWEDAEGKVYLLDYRDEEHIDLLSGFTVSSASAGEALSLQRVGWLDAAGLGLVPGRVWLGENGRPTQVPPEDGFDILIGYATAEERLFLNIQDNILLGD